MKKDALKFYATVAAPRYESYHYVSASIGTIDQMLWSVRTLTKIPYFYYHKKLTLAPYLFLNSPTIGLQSKITIGRICGICTDYKSISKTTYGRRRGAKLPGAPWRRSLRIHFSIEIVIWRTIGTHEWVF